MEREYRASPGKLEASGRKLTGYGTVWGVAYPIGGGRLERMAPGAVELDDLEITVGHDGPVLASVRGGTLEARADDTGLYIETELDEDDPDARGALAKLRRGDVRGLSVGMFVREDRQVDGVREIRRASVFEVALVGRPANPAAEAEIRAAATSDVPKRIIRPGLWALRPVGPDGKEGRAAYVRLVPGQAIEVGAEPTEGEIA